MSAGRAAGAVLLALCLAAGACSSDDGQSLPTPSSSSTTTTTLPLDFSEVALAPIAPGKQPPVTRPPGPGKASIAGKVVDTDGAPIAGAMVRAAYYFDAAKPEIIEAVSGPDGGYRFDQLYGGRWRIRAWLAPLLATFEQPAFFLAAAEQKVVDLKVKSVPEMDVTSTMAPDPPLVGWLAELAVLVVTQTVDPEGRVVRTPLGGATVGLWGDGSWTLSGSAAQATNEDGTARWTMSCGSEGVHSMNVTVASDIRPPQNFPVASPSCLSPASTTTASTMDPASSTSSTKPKPKTTTTTRPKTTSSTRPPVQPR